MNKLILALLLLSPIAQANGFKFVAKQLSAAEKYIVVGVGYKFYEALATNGCKESIGCHWTTARSHPLTARIEFGLDFNNVRVGLTHHSQWFDGKPFNDKNEYSKNEIFVDYVFKWK